MMDVDLPDRSASDEDRWEERHGARGLSADTTHQQDCTCSARIGGGEALQIARGQCPVHGDGWVYTTEPVGDPHALCCRSCAQAVAEAARLKDAWLHSLDEAMRRWHETEAEREPLNAAGWLGLTDAEYAMYAEGRYSDLAAALASARTAEGDET